MKWFKKMYRVYYDFPMHWQPWGWNHIDMTKRYWDGECLNSEAIMNITPSAKTIGLLFVGLSVFALTGCATVQTKRADAQTDLTYSNTNNGAFNNLEVIQKQQEAERLKAIQDITNPTFTPVEMPAMPVMPPMPTYQPPNINFR